MPDLLALADDVRPHLLREPYEFAAWLAAERSGLPMVVHAIGVVTGSPVLFAALAGGPLASARTATGLPADPDLRSLYGGGIIIFYPPSLRFLQLPPPDVPQQPIRLPPPGPARLPFERVRPGRPLVDGLRACGCRRGTPALLHPAVADVTRGQCVRSPHCLLAPKRHRHLLERQRVARKGSTTGASCRLALTPSIGRLTRSSTCLRMSAASRPRV